MTSAAPAPSGDTAVIAPGAFVHATAVVDAGAVIGANATIVCGATLGRYCFVGASAVVTRNVADYALVVGNPAKPIGWVCECGERLTEDLQCLICEKEYDRTDLGIARRVR
jgi:UDP-2-acetamido-3-amino-2,3-dideoxy-glucuronate N-acetyltransferase